MMKPNIAFIILITLITALLAPLAAINANDAPQLPPAELPSSIDPSPEWTVQATEDAKQDFSSIPFDGKTPDKLACDTTNSVVSDFALRSLLRRKYEHIVCPWSASHPRHDHQLIFPLDAHRLMLVWCEYYANRPSLLDRTPILLAYYSRPSSRARDCEIMLAIFDVAAFTRIPSESVLK